MQQLIFDLFPAAPPSFDNFVVGPNAEAVTALRQFVAAHFGVSAGGDGTASTGLFLWGAPGAGKTHLLEAAAAFTAAAGFAVHRLHRLPGEERPAFPGTAAPADAPPALWIADDVDTADEALQAYLFTLYNALKENGGALLASAALPPAQLKLREDLRTRLGWGGIYEIAGLRDTDKPQALIHHAAARGLKLSEDSVAYLLLHSRRDMRSLVALLDALADHSLSLKRPLTLPLIRDWLRRQKAG